MYRTFRFSIFVLLIGFNTCFGQRKVLIEQFTNSGCTPCANNTPLVASYVNTNPNDVLMLSYHTSFPYHDSMYYENAFQSNQKVAFYSIPSVPYSIVDGNFFTGNLIPTLNTTLTSAGTVLPRYNITFSSSTLNGSNITMNLIFESTNSSNSGEQLKAMIVLAEKNVLKSAYICCAGNNAEIEYPWVVRRMLPDENGTTLINTLYGGIDNIILSYNSTNVKIFNELRVIAFVQNTVSKAIYQSEISAPVIATGISEFNKQSDDLFYLTQSIINNSISIKAKNSHENLKVSILNSLGSQVYKNNYNSNEFTLSTVNYKSGIYFIKVEGSNFSQTKKIIITQ